MDAIDATDVVLTTPLYQDRAQGVMVQERLSQTKDADCAVILEDTYGDGIPGRLKRNCNTAGRLS